MAIVTLLKSTFSGTRELAERVSEDLGYRLVVRDDFIDEIAEYGMSRQRQDRACRRRLGILRPIDLGWAHYRVYLGDDGRGLLRGFPNVLTVKVVADMECRIDNLIERTDYAISRKKAKRIVEKSDERTVRCRRTLYDDGWGDPSDFDLVIEPGRTSISEACRLIRAAVEQPQYQTAPKTLDTIEQLTVAAELRSRIAMDVDVVDDNVDVEVRDGVITVAGSVRSATDLHAIRELLH